ncbi:MAG TPA: helix-turn-helix domain-containing protein [Bryobacteraceae bacterium]
MLLQEEQYQQEFETRLPPGAEELIRQRLDLLALAQELRNVRKACQRAGISRSRFYELKTAFEQHGPAGLAPQPRRKLRMPNETPPELVESILNATARYPTYSYIRISDKLRSGGCIVAPSTVRIVWEQRALNSCIRRLLWLQQTSGDLPARYTRLLQKLSEPKSNQPRKRNAPEAAQDFVCTEFEQSGAILEFALE